MGNYIGIIQRLKYNLFRTKKLIFNMDSEVKYVKWILTVYEFWEKVHNMDFVDNLKWQFSWILVT